MCITKRYDYIPELTGTDRNWLKIPELTELDIYMRSNTNHSHLNRCLQWSEIMLPHVLVYFGPADIILEILSVASGSFDVWLCTYNVSVRTWASCAVELTSGLELITFFFFSYVFISRPILSVIYHWKAENMLFSMICNTQKSVQP